MPVVVGPKQPSKKKSRKPQQSVAINQPIGKIHVPGGQVFASINKVAQFSDEATDVAVNPIKPVQARYSDPHVEDETVDNELDEQIKTSADHLALED